ncbi:MAG TPA: 5'-3' exonuclease H3TH domain-containing protein, partial [Pseudohongiella sp.]|nr:5'-3' exonuclease H3TH domain-containing protein [Pseudohongiella sp.]
MASVSPLILVDGSSYLFRAYHALPPLVTSRGQATGAIKGVISMIRSLKKEYPDSPVAIVFDAKGGTFRNDIYDKYKANRPPMPDDLRTQIDPIHHIIRAMGLPLLVVPGVEADDVIGTLALQAQQQQRDTLISTGDKDLAQLVNEHVTLINTMTGEKLDPNGVVAKFGLPPSRIVDFLALTGDKVDNIPGVPGVGPKTAVKWLQDFGSVEEIIANADQIGGKIGEKLRDNIGLLRLSYELATIKLDVPLDLKLEQLVPGEEDKSQLLALFTELEFRSWIKELESQGVDVSAETVSQAREQLGLSGESVTTVDSDDSWQTESKDYRLVSTAAELDDCIDSIRKAGRVSIAVLDSGGHFMLARIIGLAFSWEPGQAVYLALDHDSLDSPSVLDRKDTLKRLKPLLENP